MPTTVIREVTASDLRIRDRIVACEQNSQVIDLVVESKTFGRTRYKIGFAGGRVRAFYPADVFTVEREEATPQEIAARERQDQIRILHNYRLEFQRRSNKRIMNKALEERDGYLGWSELGNLMEEQEIAACGKFIQESYEKYAEVVDDDLLALLGAFAGLIRVRDNRYNKNPMSRSTHQISNLMEEMQAYVVRDCLEQVTRWNEITEDAMLAAQQVCNEALADAREAA